LLGKSSVKGYIYVMLSAVLFGFTPVLAAMSYEGGNNGVNMTFLRALLPIPILFLLARREKVKKISKRQALISVILGVFAYGCTLQLNLSYAYISVGVATTLHFLYPLYVSLYELTVQKIKKSPLYFVGLFAALLGAAFFLDQTGQGFDIKGVSLALISGIFYAAYMIILDGEKERALPLFSLTLGISLTGFVVFGAFGLITRELTFNMTQKAWAFAFVAAILSSVGAIVLFQAGLRVIGKADAAIFSLLEPICSIIFSILLMGDRMTFTKLLGCALIIFGLFLTTAAEKRSAFKVK